MYRPPASMIPPKPQGPKNEVINTSLEKCLKKLKVKDIFTLVTILLFLIYLLYVGLSFNVRIASLEEAYPEVKIYKDLKELCEKRKPKKCQVTMSILEVD